MQGAKFPAALIMLSKVMLTLEGVLGDILDSDKAIGSAIARHVAMHWLRHREEFRSPLRKSDWLTLQCSALLLPGRLSVRWQQTILDHWLASKPVSAAAR